MTISAEKISELRVKHLEMLQSLITRMASYGASFKSYCITVATTVIGFGFTPGLVSALAILPVSPLLSPTLSIFVETVSWRFNPSAQKAGSAGELEINLEHAPANPVNPPRKLVDPRLDARWRSSRFI